MSKTVDLLREAALSLESNGLGPDLCEDLRKEADKLEADEKKALEKGDRKPTRQQIESGVAKGDARGV
jgi:hypothetical protein